MSDSNLRQRAATNITLQIILRSPYPKQIIGLRQPRGRRPRRQRPVPAPRKVGDPAHLGLHTRGKSMRIRTRNPRTRVWGEWLGEEADQLARVDEFGKGVRARLDEAEHLFGCYDGQEVRERRPRDGRKEKVSARLDGWNRRRKARECYEGGRAGRTLTSSAHDLRNAAGLSTCSMTSIEQTTSNRFGSCTSVSAKACRKESEARCGSAAAWRVATWMFSAEASMASVFAPRRVRL
jgi:hypothetical protein